MEAIPEFKQKILTAPNALRHSCDTQLAQSLSGITAAIPPCGTLSRSAAPVPFGGHTRVDGLDRSRGSVRTILWHPATPWTFRKRVSPRSPPPPAPSRLRRQLRGRAIRGRAIRDRATRRPTTRRPTTARQAFRSLIPMPERRRRGLSNRPHPRRFWARHRDWAAVCSAPRPLSPPKVDSSRPLRHNPRTERRSTAAWPINRHR